MTRGRESKYGSGFPSGSEESFEEEQRVSGKDPLRKKKEAISKNPDSLERLIQEEERSTRIEAGEEEEDEMPEIEDAGDIADSHDWRGMFENNTPFHDDPPISVQKKEKQEERAHLPMLGRARHEQSKKQQGISAEKKVARGYGHKSWRNLGRKPRSKK